MKFKFFLNKSVGENANLYFDKVKKLRAKIDGATKTLEKAKKDLDLANSNFEKKVQKQESAKLFESRSVNWFEKFHWFFSSDNFLVVAGKNANSNDEIVKKYLEKNDKICHTQEVGSPFTIIKNPENKEVPLSTIIQACTLTATFSKTLAGDFASADVFVVGASQVSNTPKSGEYLEKGSFIITGKKEFHSSKFDLAFGLYNYKSFNLLMAGPLKAVQANCKVFVKIRKGNLKKSDVANQIMRKLKLSSNDQVLAQLPSGKFAIVDN